MIKNKAFAEDKLKIFINVVIVCFLTLTACSKSQSSGDSNDAPSTTDNGTNDVPPDKSYLWLHHKGVHGALRITHKAVTSGSWPDQCKVDLDATNPADRDIKCITETAELDLMHVGMTLEFNVPEHVKCPYAITMSPYFMRFEPPHLTSPYITDGSVAQSIPPRFVYQEINEIAGTYSVSGFYNDPSSVSPVANTNIIVTSSDGANGYRCKFDYTGIRGGVNCCAGDYTLITKTTASDSTVTINRSSANWGGKPGACLSGPATTLQKVDIDTGFPAAYYWRKEEQGFTNLLLQKKSFQNPIELMSELGPFAETSPADPAFGKFEMKGILEDFYSSRYLANYFKTEPPAFNILTSSSTLLYGGYTGGSESFGRVDLSFHDPRYFTVICADANREVYARIQLQIREWNTYANLEKKTEPVNDEDDESGSEDFPGSGSDDYDKADFADWEDPLPEGRVYPGSAL